jgi:hypothetical protein
MSIRAAVIFTSILALSFLFSPWAVAGEAGQDEGRLARLMKGEILVETLDPETGLFRGTGLVRAPWGRLWQGLTEVDHFTRIFTENMGGERTDHGAEYDVYCFHPRFFLMTFDYCLRRTLDRPSRRIMWSLTEGDFEEVEGEWSLEPVDDGRMTLVSFTNRVKAGSWIPESWIQRGARQRIPQTLEAIRLWGETGRYLPEE